MIRQAVWWWIQW